MKRYQIILITTGLMMAIILLWARFDAGTEDSTTWHLPLSGKVIVLDPGHGGMDGGASSKEGVLEKEVTLEVSIKLRDYLQEAGALVLMTREEDVDLANEGTKKIKHRKTEDLKKRVEMVNESDADFFISVHMNAIPSPKWRGAQTFYHLKNKQNEDLAVFIQEEMKRNLENTNRYAKPIHHVYLLKQATIPGALIEAGFLSNPEEALLLETDDYQQKMAASIYEGILRFASGEKAPAANPYE
ncbi:MULTISPECIES: N-acetylmuramoyl-L-alanine amidase CwlD [Shouchella]|uniref:Germination-specific N-acetylmuramoyl-L-alanine amidase n=3 Tax=Bacillaceae TaxID=186817 RepID=A0A060LY06_9BACI|nr:MULTISPECIES: N-acetylmuramoyl-L-alanine amidase CwlD [Bacillaceae]RQW23627.1 N-acetylmuramoyl-L-alanine amidase CwlD [Bacillus sp. C1-1]AIC92694.1 germination-specific N-acetylmuramoyl-L-alanine amidase [Shouchella lehensis G1]KQL56900.1 N-acetylmuramoyl-L-alanine amidase [Alkalicoccobacillus plakortidis]MBG9782432.1 N-acetylmuramoyl-L-alanine amidase [Shouchella lehensis]TES49123.1 N-acetylmuramoyl-L-alanine amidase CwlD [Shouchella lehensis]